MACYRVNFTLLLLLLVVVVVMVVVVVVVAVAATGTAAGGVITSYLAMSIHLHGAAELLLDGFV